MLEAIYKNYKDCADEVVPNWQSLNKNLIANKCVEFENDPVLGQGYFAALILRYWGNIGNYYNKSKNSGFSIYDCYDWYIDALQYAIRKRKWLDPTSSMYNDPNGPDKIINRVIYSRRQLNYYLANREKRKANFGKSSLDSLEAVVEDHNVALMDTLEDARDPIKSLTFDLLLKEYGKQGNLLKILILDDIYYGFPFTSKTMYGRVKYSFKPSAIVNDIYDYSPKTLEDLASKYNLNLDNLNNTIENLRSSGKVKVSKIVRTTLADLKNDTALKELFLCS